MNDQTKEKKIFDLEKTLKFIDEIVDNLNTLENDISDISDSTIGDVQYYIDGCSHTAESIKEELNDFFQDFTETE